ncbi:hypothetical protein MATL_G00002820 [Megalops atlanticus]|uniref:UDENN domain-containing protein n=1 Tax=Megalops atlanticus TaxID=7932 RepID=A0A9D3QFU7_MEGAT|nr:hypothetical protein MATL_G00002820 [Megalops atlanticus]
MGSRLKQNPERTFYWFFEASCPIARDKDPEVLFQFPEDFSDEESLQTLPRFCFPYDIERVRESVAVQHFTFVLTDMEGCQRFGFCRLTSSSRTCLCILSYLPWFEVFYKLLNNLADYLTKGQTNEMRELLSVLYKHPVPLANSTVTLQLGEQLQIRTGEEELPHGLSPLPPGTGKSGIPYFIAPDPRSLPSIPESRNLTELVVAVDVSNLLQLYASMLFERRILISSSKLSTLTACVHACSAILYPMYWQHIFIPVLPPHLLDYCCAPMPYLIGVHSSLTEIVRSRALEDVVILNVDTNTMESPFEDLKRIPSDVMSLLKVRLKKQAAVPGLGVARAFLKAQALLFGGYRDALLCTDGGPFTFCEESFLNHKSNSMRQFLESAVHLQFFKQFIDGRLEALNSGREPMDLFEEEILQCGESAGGTKSYQQLVGNLKKGGGALIHTVKSKASMCKSAKAHAKSSLRNFLSPKEDGEPSLLYRGGSLRSDPPGTHAHRRAQSDCLQSRLPITQHFGKSRPRRPARRYTGRPQEETTLYTSNNWTPDWEDGAVDAGQSGGDSGQQEDSVDDFLPDSEELDLLGEIFDTLSTRSSHERGLLYGTRSLDLFGADSTDYISRRDMTAPSQESLNNSVGMSGSLLSWGQEEGPDESEEGPEGQEEESAGLGVGSEGTGEGPGTAGKGPQGQREQIEEEELAGQSQEKDRCQHDKAKECHQEEGVKALDKELQQEETAKEEQEDEQDNQKDSHSQEESPGKHSQLLYTGTLALSSEAETAPTSSSFIAQEDQASGRGEIETVGEEPQPKGEECGNTPQIDPITPSQASCLSGPNPEAEGGEGGNRSPMPRVQSALALFQAREGKASAGPGQAWTASALKKPAGACKGGNIGPKKIPQGGILQTLSPDSPPRVRDPAKPVGTPAAGALPVGVHTDPGTPTEEGDLPPVKVSELKKRFEA